MIKWILGSLLLTVPFLAFCQAEAPMDYNAALTAIFELGKQLLVGKPSAALIALVVSQIAVIVAKSAILDDLVGKNAGTIKMWSIAILSAIIPAATFYIANPHGEISKLLADSTFMAAIQVLGHQLILHTIGKKKAQ